MKISVFGLGYVGVVSCGCLARDGASVIGVDVNPEKVAMINAGESPIVEAHIGELLAQAVAAGALRATTDVAEAVRDSDVSLISVGTPSLPNGGLDVSAVERVASAIGAALATKETRHLVVVRSTVLPGTVKAIVVPALEAASGKVAGAGFGICFNPEFLREGTSVNDHYDPPFTLMGADRRDDSERAAAIYQAVRAPVFHTSIETAELVKYVCNAFHALKVTFANEIGALARGAGVDGHEVMDIVCRDTKLNISRRYLRPGFAFGGSCLPKDVRAILHRAREMDLDVPLLAAVLASNRMQIERTVAGIVALKKRKVGILGLTFKEGTDDLRESPMVALAETLIGKGFDVRIYDRGIALTRLVGANKQYIDRELPHLSALLTGDLEGLVGDREVLVVGNGAPELAALPNLCREGQIVIDLVRVPGLDARRDIDYRGVAW
jgi:GDP-mannose 6-dehydrogenase